MPNQSRSRIGYSNHVEYNMTYIWDPNFGSTFFTPFFHHFLHQFFSKNLWCKTIGLKRSRCTKNWYKKSKILKQYPKIYDTKNIQSVQNLTLLTYYTLVLTVTKNVKKSVTREFPDLVVFLPVFFENFTKHRKNSPGVTTVTTVLLAFGDFRT